MKDIVKTLMFSATLAVAMLVAISAQAKDGAVVNTTGTVEYTNDAGVWQTVAKKAVIKEGTKIRTGATDSSATFKLGNTGSKLTLSNGTSLAIDKASSEKVGNQTVSETAIDLTAGSVIVVASGINGASTFSIKTASKTVSLKASQCVCSISADGSVTVLKGLAEAAGVTVLAGKTLVADAAAPTDANPVVLAAIGNLSLSVETKVVQVSDDSNAVVAVENPKDVREFADYLLTKGIDVDYALKGSLNDGSHDITPYRP